ncbi:hypothetical protein VB715_19695 [Crocosphaera sp. UHCC 0190]|uniref:hypothetical protein n=1 Tax=Crocosphaera sp. UHCC 0190 TaxID=3110246 RepID=UPI002B1F012B|nr:hypothetical protein [Crocosphaera sp. UHCC 0190]MEA5512000.1 hypothetical protein [Crocosphaera sp. UHCC 0190]
MFSNIIKKSLINSFIVFILFLIVTDALPETSLVHRYLKQAIDPLLDKIGIWQGTWQLFAPDVDKSNNRFLAEITFSDNTQGIWYSPNWSKMSIEERFLKFRHMEYYDSIYFEGNSNAWQSLADHLSRTIVSADNPDAKPIKIILIREWANIPAPSQKNLSPILPENNFNHRYKFYKWESSK